tara:strand:- start:52 stop:390 length:339 start_codon:yes stop_codon:yes gene_type:complete
MNKTNHNLTKGKQMTYYITVDSKVYDYDKSNDESVCDVYREIHKIETDEHLPTCVEMWNDNQSLQDEHDLDTIAHEFNQVDSYTVKGYPINAMKIDDNTFQDKTITCIDWIK